MGFTARVEEVLVEATTLLTLEVVDALVLRLEITEDLAALEEDVIVVETAVKEFDVVEVVVVVQGGRLTESL